MSEELQKGDSVSWNWGSGQPSGTVEAVVPEEHSIESKNGKEIKKKGTEDNPAVEIKQDSGNPVLKRASELNEVETE